MDHAFGSRTGLHLLAHGRFGAVEVAGIGEIGSRSRERTFPEPAAGLAVGDGGFHVGAQAAGQRGEVADAFRQQRLELFADRLGQHGRRAIGADGGDNIAPVDDRGDGKVAQFGMVDDVQRYAVLARHGDGTLGILVETVGDDGETGDIQRRAGMVERRNRDATGELFSEARIDLVDDHGDVSGRRSQQANLAARLFSAAENHDRRVVHVEEGRKLAHWRPLLFSIADRSGAKMALDGSGATVNPYSEPLEILFHVRSERPPAAPERPARL